MADIDNVTVGENNYNLRDSAAQNALPTQGQVDDIITALNTIANKTDHPYNASNKLPTDYADDTNQTHKFATQAQLTQIETNKNNILLIEANGGGINVFELNPTSYTSDKLTITVNADKTITASTGGQAMTTDVNLVLGRISLSGNYFISGCPEGGGVNTYSLLFGKTGYTVRDVGEGVAANSLDGSEYTLYLSVKSGQTLNNLIFKPMMISKSSHDNGFMGYQPYALSNAELTELEKKNESNISWNINSGVKNFLNFDADTMKSINTGGTWSGNTWSIGNNVTLTINSDRSITLNGTANAGKTIYLAKNLGMAENAYTLSTGALTTKLWAGIIEVGGTENNYTGSTTHIDKTCQPNHINLYIESGCTLSNFTVYPMLTLKSLYDADPTYQPFALPNTALTPALVECVDNGVKNRLPATSTTTSTTNGLTLVVNSDYSITITGTMTTVENTDIYFIGAWTNVSPYANYTGKNMRIYCKSSVSISGQFKMYDRTANKGYAVAINNNEGVNISGNLTAAYFTIAATSNAINVTLYPMICEPSLYIVSQQYVPPAMSNAELTAAEKQNENNILIEDITNKVSMETGFTIDSSYSKLYKQGNHVFGNLVLKKSTGVYNSTGDTVATITDYPPILTVVNAIGLTNTVNQMQNIGWIYISSASESPSGSITIRDAVGTINNCAVIQIDYVTA